MQFQSLRLGGGGQRFTSTNTTRLPFQFPIPIQGAYALLQGMRLKHKADRGTYYSSGGDEELSLIEVSAVVLFDALQSKTSGEVQIHFRFPGTTSPATADLVQGEIDVLVVGV
jgi:hypothetical protein